MTDGLVFDRRASLVRKVYSAVSGQYTATTVLADFACCIIPISDFDQVTAYAYESTHKIVVPHWLVLRKDDEVHYGRRPPNPQGDILPHIYTINGRRPFRMGTHRTSYYARELD